jgi:TrmH family RNA methyltransferase
MIPLEKLERLPRSQRLRKAASIIGGTEHRFVEFGELPAGEIEYLCNLAAFLSRDEHFSKAALAGLKTAHSVLTAIASSDGAVCDGTPLRRSLNAIHHVLLAETGRYTADWDFYRSPGVLDLSKRRPFAGMQVYLEDIRSPFNVGSMFRAAESFGAEKIWLSPLCADPRHKRAERTAMGCVDILPWERFSADPFTGLKESETSDHSFCTGPFFALETGGTPLADFSFPERGIMIAGSEELGVSPPALAAADASAGRVSIPVYGAKGSLNVSVAFGIVMQAWAATLKDLS